MYIGLRDGYVRFGTVHHKVLLLMAEQRLVSYKSMLTAFRIHYPDTPNVESAIANAFSRFLKYSKGYPWAYVYFVGYDRDKGGRMYRLYSLYPKHYHRHRPTVVKMTDKERRAAYKERKRLKVASVFAFRGNIKVKENEDVEIVSNARHERERPAPASWREAPAAGRAGAAGGQAD